MIFAGQPAPIQSVSGWTSRPRRPCSITTRRGWRGHTTPMSSRRRSAPGFLDGNRRWRRSLGAPGLQARSASRPRHLPGKSAPPERRPSVHHCPSQRSQCLRRRSCGNGTSVISNAINSSEAMWCAVKCEPPLSQAALGPVSAAGRLKVACDRSQFASGQRFDIKLRCPRTFCAS